MVGDSCHNHHVCKGLKISGGLVDPVLSLGEFCNLPDLRHMEFIVAEFQSLDYKKIVT